MECRNKLSYFIPSRRILGNSLSKEGPLKEDRNVRGRLILWRLLVLVWISKRSKRMLTLTNNSRSGVRVFWSRPV